MRRRRRYKALKRASGVLGAAVAFWALWRGSVGRGGHPAAVVPTDVVLTAEQYLRAYEAHHPSVYP